MNWNDEMESHIAMRAEANERAGMGQEEARRAAERAFGNRARISEEVRAVSFPVWLDQLLQDLRYAARGFVHTPGFTLTALVALTVGIGTSTAVFSFADRILFRSLPYANERELVWFGMNSALNGGTEFILETDYHAFKRSATPFASMAVTAGVSDCTLSELNPAPLTCGRVTPEFLSLLGYRPLAGRDFNEEDGRPGAPPSALVSAALWRSRFGGGDIEGKTLEIDGKRTSIAGVLPTDFEMPSLARVDVLQVLQLEPAKAALPSMLLTAFARLKPGVTPAQARGRMEPLFAASLKNIPDGLRKQVQYVVHSLRERQARDSERAALLLLGAAALVLSISVSNVANLLVARAAARRRELAVRAAIGAGRARLARQALTESLLLGMLGCAGGLILAPLLLRVFRRVAPAGIARLDGAAIDWRVAACALMAALVASLLFGLAPAMRSPSSEPLTGARAAGPGREWLRPALVITQIALSLTLLCGAGLLLQSLRNMANAPLGMETTSLFSVYAQLPGSRYSAPAQRAAFWKSLEERIRSIPGVEAEAISDSLPPAGRAQARALSSIQVEGRPKASAPHAEGMAVVREVSAGYFPMLGVRVRQGRLFADGDKGSLVLSERMAARLFPGEPPLGRRVVMTGEGTFEVTAVVSDVRNGGLIANSDPEMYMISKRDGRRQHVIVRAGSNVMPLVRAAVRELDPRLVAEIETLDDRVSNLRARPRFQSMLLGGFALAGLLLAAIGLHGVVSLLATQRTAEIGVRMALGATGADIRAMMFRQVRNWTGAGIALGLCGAAAGSALIRGLLYEVHPFDPMPLVLAISLLVIAAAIAAWLPARRASRVAPVQALRSL